MSLVCSPGFDGSSTTSKGCARLNASIVPPLAHNLSTLAGQVRRLIRSAGGASRPAGDSRAANAAGGHCHAGPKLRRSHEGLGHAVLLRGMLQATKMTRSGAGHSISEFLARKVTNADQQALGPGRV